MQTHSSPSPAEIIAALQRGGIGEALKLVLTAKGNGSTAEAGKVARQPKRHRPVPTPGQASDLSPGEVPRSNNDIWIMLLAVAALCIAYYLHHEA
jgi:hypothetical protein